jgi:hypothetical protein
MIWAQVIIYISHSCRVFYHNHCLRDCVIIKALVNFCTVFCLQSHFPVLYGAESVIGVDRALLVEKHRWCLVLSVQFSLFLCICLIQYVVGNYCKTFRPSWKAIKLLHQRGKLLEWYFQTHSEMLLLWQDCFTMLRKLCIDIILWEPSTNWDIHYKNIRLVLHHAGSVYLWTVNRWKIICDCRSVC